MKTYKEQWLIWAYGKRINKIPTKSTLWWWRRLNFLRQSYLKTRPRIIYNSVKHSVVNIIGSVFKILRLKLYLPRQKWTRNETLIFSKIVLLRLNTFISSKFPLAKHFWNTSFDMVWVVSYFHLRTWLNEYGGCCWTATYSNFFKFQYHGAW